MPEFKYKAIDQQGRIRRGRMPGSSKAFVKNRLRNLRLKPLSVKAYSIEKAEDEGGLLSRLYYIDNQGRLQITLLPESITDKDLIIFTKQFATMLASGVPLVQALGVLADQQRVRYFGRVLGRIRNAVENGASLSESMEAHPKIFNELYTAMVRAGEASGNIDTILLKLVVYIERSAKIRSQVRAAMVYPTLVVFVAVVVVSGLLIFIVPQFAEQYSQAGQTLPELTQIVIDLSTALTNYWYVLLAFAVAAVVGLNVVTRTPAGKLTFDTILLKAPVFGNLVRKVAVGRFCSTMATMLSSGVNLLEGLTICAASSGNRVVEKFVRGVRVAVEQGEKLSTPLSKSDLFPAMVTSMVSVGETTGALDEMLGKVSEFYEEEVDVAVTAILSLIEPVLIIVIGAIVGFIVIALYLPVFDMATTTQ